eukprot:3088468-Ditylum_brightwellii.AAC.1
MINDLPDNAVRAKGSWLGSNILIQAHITCKVALSEQAAPEQTSFCVYLQSLPRHAQQLLGTQIDQDPDAKHWMDTLKSGKV